MAKERTEGVAKRKELESVFQKMYGFEGLGLSEVQLSISELSVVEVGGWWVGGPDKRTSWSDLVGVRQRFTCD